MFKKKNLHLAVAWLAILRVSVINLKEEAFPLTFRKHAKFLSTKLSVRDEAFSCRAPRHKSPCRYASSGTQSLLPKATFSERPSYDFSSIPRTASILEPKLRLHFYPTVS